MAQQMIFCCRSYSAFQAIPPTLLCPQFSQFVIDLDSCIPSTLDIEQFHQLRHIMADESIYDDGLERCAYFINNIREYGFRDFHQEPGGKFYNGGELEVYVEEVDQIVSYCVVQVEYKFEERGAEPIASPALYWLKTIRLFTEGRRTARIWVTLFLLILIGLGKRTQSDIHPTLR